MISVRRAGLAAALILMALGPAQAQDRVTLGFVYDGEIPADEREMVEDPLAVATANWVDSVQVFLGPQVLQLQRHGWYAAREGESPDYLIQIVGLPVVAGEVATGMMVLAVTVLEAEPDDDTWRYLGQSIDYYEGDAREAIPRIIDTLTGAIESRRGD